MYGGTIINIMCLQTLLLLRTADILSFTHTHMPAAAATCVLKISFICTQHLLSEHLLSNVFNYDVLNCTTAE